MLNMQNSKGPSCMGENLIERLITYSYACLQLLSPVQFWRYLKHIGHTAFPHQIKRWGVHWWHPPKAIQGNKCKGKVKETNTSRKMTEQTIEWHITFNVTKSQIMSLGKNLNFRKKIVSLSKLAPARSENLVVMMYSCIKISAPCPASS